MAALNVTAYKVTYRIAGGGRQTRTVQTKDDVSGTPAEKIAAVLALTHKCSARHVQIVSATTPFGKPVIESTEPENDAPAQVRPTAVEINEMDTGALLDLIADRELQGVNPDVNLSALRKQVVAAIHGGKKAAKAAASK